MNNHILIITMYGNPEGWWICSARRIQKAFLKLVFPILVGSIEALTLKMVKKASFTVETKNFLEIYKINN